MKGFVIKPFKKLFALFYDHLQILVICLFDFLTAIEKGCSKIWRDFVLIKLLQIVLSF